MSTQQDSVPRHRESWRLKSALKVKYAFQIPPDPSAAEDTELEPALPSHKGKRKQANLYDAVAGRVTTTNSLKAVKANPNLAMGDPMSARDPRLAPEEAYSKRKKAKPRYQEFDRYFAHGTDRLSGTHKELPDSDMLKSIHAYSSRFYEAKAVERDMERIAKGKKPRSVRGKRLIDERTMNETALLAFGILLEEAGLEVLGPKGDMVFVESSKDEEKCFGKDTETRWADVPAPLTPLPIANPFPEPGETPPRALPMRPAVLNPGSATPHVSGQNATMSGSREPRATSASSVASNTRSRRSGSPAPGGSPSDGEVPTKRKKKKRMGGDSDSDEPLDESLFFQFRRQYPKKTKKRRLSQVDSSTSGG